MPKKSPPTYLLILADICSDSTITHVVAEATERPWAAGLLVAVGLALKRLAKRQR